VYTAQYTYGLMTVVSWHAPSFPSPPGSVLKALQYRVFRHLVSRIDAILMRLLDMTFFSQPFVTSDFSQLGQFLDRRCHGGATKAAGPRRIFPRCPTLRYNQCYTFLSIMFSLTSPGSRDRHERGTSPRKQKNQLEQQDHKTFPIPTDPTFAPFSSLHPC
jgi:hypothetical protein